MRIARKSVDEVRAATAIEEVVGQYVRLKRAGSALKGLCPFHSEKSPSFHVRADRGFFYCFGCQASGDAIGFLQQIEGLAFAEAVVTLAERAGIELVYEGREGAVQDDGRRALYAVLAFAQARFAEWLWGEGGAAGRALLQERAVSRDAAEHFGLGFAPPGFQVLTSALERGGFALADAERAGLIAQGQRGYYDRFRSRLVFPVYDLSGHVVAFSGRLVEGAVVEAGASQPPAPKYYNSPESSIYRKSDQMFGLFQQRVALRKASEVVLCEGNFDVVQVASIAGAVGLAPLGTALTERQVAVLRRFSDRVALAFDGDDAGRKATLRALEALLPAGFDVRVLELGTDDPDSLLRREGSAGWERVLAAGRDGVSVVLDHLFADRGRSDVNHYRDVAAEVRRWAAYFEGMAQQVFLEAAVKRFPATLRSKARGVLFQQAARAPGVGARGARPGQGSNARLAGAQSNLDGAVSRMGHEAGGDAGAPEALDIHSVDTLELSLVGAFLDGLSAGSAQGGGQGAGRSLPAELPEVLVDRRLTLLWTWLRQQRDLPRPDDVAALGLPTALGQWVMRRLAEPVSDEASAPAALLQVVSAWQLRSAKAALREESALLMAAMRAGDQEASEAHQERIANLQRRVLQLQSLKTVASESAS